MSMCFCVNLLQRCNRICVWTVCAAECHSAIYFILAALSNEEILALRQNLTLLLYVVFMLVILRISKNGKKNKAGTHGIGLYPLFFFVKIWETIFWFHPIFYFFDCFFISFFHT